MGTIQDWDASDWAAGAAVASVLVNLLLVLVATRQLSLGRRLREEEARPLVHVAADVTGTHVIRLVTTNLGRTMARDVRLSFDPPLDTTLQEGDIIPQLLDRMTEPIAQLAPKERVVCVWDRLDPRMASDLPGRHLVVARYTSSRRRRLVRRVATRYVDEYVLDLSKFAGMNLELDAAGRIADELRAMRESAQRHLSGELALIVRNVDGTLPAPSGMDAISTDVSADGAAVEAAEEPAESASPGGPTKIRNPGSGWPAHIEIHPPDA